MTTRREAETQVAAYREAAERYRAEGNTFIAERLTQIADHISRTLRATA